MYDFPSKYAKLKNGTTFHYVEVSPVAKKADILCVHGFPDCWFGYRKIIQPLAEAGFRVIVPDQRGYGQSSTSTNAKDFQMEFLVQDNIELLNYLKIDKVILVGHDWGGTLVWDLAVHFPERVLAVCGVCTPFFPVNVKKNPLKAMQEDPGRFAYQVYFQTKEAELEFDANPTETVRKFFVSEMDDSGGKTPFKDRPGLRTFLTPEEEGYYAKNWAKSTSFGPLSWYRNVEENWKWSFSVAGKKVISPSLMICAENDKILPPSMVESVGMKDNCLNLRVKTVNGCGHWILQEKPHEVITILLDWLKSQVPKATAKV